MKRLLALLAVCALASTASAQVIFNLSFQTDAEGFQNAGTATPTDVVWNASDGNPAGSLLISGTNPSNAGAAFIGFKNQAINLNGATKAIFSLDMKITDPLVGAAVHMGLNFSGDVRNQFDLQNKGINDQGFTTLTWTFENLNPTANNVYIDFNVAGGAFEGSGGGIAIDNIRLTAVPEPATTGALAGAGALGLALFVRRRRKQAQ